MKATFFAVACSAAMVAASPLGKRQSSSAPAVVSPATDMPTVSMASGGVAPSGSMPLMPSGTSMMAMPSVSGVAMPSMPASNGSSSGSNSEAYPCPSGYLLTYVEAQMNYASSLSKVLSVAGDFQNATWLYYVNGTGGNSVGARRYLATTSGAKREVLTQYDSDRDNIALQIVANLINGPLTASNGAMISNYSTVFQFYEDHSNSTATPMSPMNNGTAITVKLFSNFCAADQTNGTQAMRTSFDTALQNIQTLLMGGKVASPGSQASPSSMIPSMIPSVMPSDMMSSGMMPSGMMSGSALPSGGPAASGNMESAGSMSNMPAVPTTSA